MTVKSATRASNRLIAVLAVPVVMASCRTAMPAATPCVFPDQPRSTIAWATPPSSDSSFSGSVIDIQMKPITSASIQLDPGSHLTMPDSTGRFRFESVPRGVYYMTVRAIGFASVSDSVTNSEFGTKLVIVLGPHRPGLLGCVRIARETGPGWDVR